MSGAVEHSALYRGRVRHRRNEPRRHDFTMSTYMCYIDLDEIEPLFATSRLWSATRPAPARFRRADYFGDPEQPLDEAVRDAVEAHTGTRPTGPIRLLTNLRHFGYVFNPVSFYYCFDAAGERVQTILAEITNTPWKERHAYVLDRKLDSVDGQGRRFRFQKIFHVSPFMPMDLDYDWAFSEPGAHLGVHMTLRRGGAKVFDATMKLERRPATAGAVWRALLRYPLITVQVIARIHWEALRLWLKRVPVFAHPKAKASGQEASTP